MARVSLFNIFLGFFLIFLASCYGAFLARDSTYALLQNKELLDSWGYILRKSAHAHTNSFGMLHILLGLTQPYSNLSLATKKKQTWGLLAGTFAMSVLLFVRSYIPVDRLAYDIQGYFIGCCLTLSLLSLASHCFGLFSKLKKRNN